MRPAAGLRRGQAGRFRRAPERVSSGPHLSGTGQLPRLWSHLVTACPAPTPWGQSRTPRGASAPSSTKRIQPCNLPLSFRNVPCQGHSHPLSIIPTVCGALSTVWGNPWPPACLALCLALPSSPQGSGGQRGVSQMSATGPLSAEPPRALPTSPPWRVPVLGWGSEPRPHVRTAWRARKKQWRGRGRAETGGSEAGAWGSRRPPGGLRAVRRSGRGGRAG